MYLRSFLVQASWSFRGMQNLGYAAITAPAVRKLLGRSVAAGGGGGTGRAPFFNTHPYLAGAVAGAEVRVRVSAGDGVDVEREAAECREMFMGALGALGDDFFWGALRPLAGGVGVLLALLGLPWTGVAALLLLYNTWHLSLRWTGLRAGLRGPHELVVWLGKVDFHRKARRFRNAATVVFAAVAMAWPGWDDNPWRYAVWILGPLALLTMGLLTVVQWRLDPRRTVFLVLAVALVASFLEGAG
jgi:mannose/fructose/N-acetylgalactosamine-specific phosphotransferase system component IID